MSNQQEKKKFIGSGEDVPLDGEDELNNLMDILEETEEEEDVLCSL